MRRDARSMARCALEEARAAMQPLDGSHIVKAAARPEAQMRRQVLRHQRQAREAELRTGQIQTIKFQPGKKERQKARRRPAGGGLGHSLDGWGATAHVAGAAGDRPRSSPEKARRGRGRPQGQELSYVDFDFPEGPDAARARAASGPSGKSKSTYDSSCPCGRPRPRRAFSGDDRGRSPAAPATCAVAPQPSRLWPRPPPAGRRRAFCRSFLPGWNLIVWICPVRSSASLACRWCRKTWRRICASGRAAALTMWEPSRGCMAARASSRAQRAMDRASRRI